MKKICTKCKQEKPLTEFRKRLNTKGVNVGTSYCKPCAKISGEEWAKKNPEKVKLSIKKAKAKKSEYYKKQNKDWAIANRERVRRREKQRYYDNIDRYRAQARKDSRKRYYGGKDGLYHVYLLPEEHYCGQTDNPRWRKYQHASNGKITDGFEIVMSFKTRKDAVKLEGCFHDLGWLGKNANY